VKLLIGRDDLADAAAAAIARTAPQVSLERPDAHPLHSGFRQFVNEVAIDICEIPVVTLLQAAADRQPVGLLPITALGRFQHHTLVSCQGLSMPDIVGASVGVRSWTQTTGVWVRGVLGEQYGVSLRDADWITYEDSHRDGHPDPRWVRRAAAGSNLVGDLIDGTLDFAVIGNDLPAGTPARPVIPDAEAAARQWSRAVGFVPVNHVVGVTLAAAREHPDVVCAVFDALCQARAAAGHAGRAVDLEPAGFAALQAPFTTLAQYALAQEILPRPVAFEELVLATCEALGVSPARLGG